MFCPLCGSKLELVDHEDETIIERNATDEEDADEVELKREEYRCTAEDPCFEADFPLYCHHPFYGINSAPGDSWSLSWVK